MDQPRQTIAALTRPFKLVALADATNRSRQAAHGWQTGDSLPDVASLPGLSRLLRISIEDLATIIAADAADRDAARSARASA